MQIRCYKCGTSFEFTRAAMEQAVADAEANHSKVTVVECVKCRQANKVPIAQIRRFLPPHSPHTPGAADAASPPAGAADEKTESEPPADKQ